jgi:hypothetical protein
MESSSNTIPAIVLNVHGLNGLNVRESGRKILVHFIHRPARSKICADNAVCLRLIYIMVAINLTFSCCLF